MTYKPKSPTSARSWWSGPPGRPPLPREHGSGANTKDSGRSESGKGKATSLRPVHDKGET